jgi:hypothetical protein
MFERVQILMLVTVNSAIFWDVRQCYLVEFYCSFEGVMSQKA